jgi:hypothetical protein
VHDLLHASSPVVRPVVQLASCIVLELIAAVYDQLQLL